MMPIHSTLAVITERIIERSCPTREAYLARIRALNNKVGWNATNWAVPT